MCYECEESRVNVVVFITNTASKYRIWQNHGNRLMKFKGFYQSDAIYSGLPVAACKPLTQGGIPT